MAVEKYKITTQDQKFVQWKVCSLYYLMLTVCLMVFLAMAWEQAESYCNKYGGHLFSFGEKKDIRVIKDLHDASHLHVDLEYWTGLKFVGDSWSFTDDTDTHYAITKFRKLEGRLSKGPCVLLRYIGKPRPSPEPTLCSSPHHFICQINTNDPTFSTRSISSKFLYLLFKL